MADRTLADLRRALVDARARLRDAEDALKLTAAQTEAAAISAGWSEYRELRNKEDRERWLLLQLDQSASYKAARYAERAARQHLEAIEAEIEIKHDEKGARHTELRTQEIANKVSEIEQQSRLLDAQERQARQQAEAEQQIVDSVLALQRAATNGVVSVADEIAAMDAPRRRDFDA